MEEFAIALFEPEENCVGHVVSLSCDCAKAACDCRLEGIFVAGLIVGLVHVREDELAPPPYRLTLKNCLGVPGFLFEEGDDTQTNQGVHKISEIAQCRVSGHAAAFKGGRRVLRDLDCCTGGSAESAAETQRNENEAAVGRIGYFACSELAADIFDSLVMLFEFLLGADYGAAELGRSQLVPFDGVIESAL